uniref:AlNc14C67G4715 protein n=1 Tax=Albugo laibachii Nc14 TaxID=890382 RepID=F0WDJ5_9STRA|nr:AlNc14C67G4715 [Albugo laibachii Nc14]|eukprot:CCA19269.1 AlNc14C67G4715 [Albugo laibachii Nc14]
MLLAVCKLVGSVGLSSGMLANEQIHEILCSIVCLIKHLHEGYRIASGTPIDAVRTSSATIAQTLGAADNHALLCFSPSSGLFFTSID